MPTSMRIKKIIRLTESDLKILVDRVLEEQQLKNQNTFNKIQPDKPLIDNTFYSVPPKGTFDKFIPKTEPVTKISYDCVGLGPDTCSRLDSTKILPLGNANTQHCAAFVTHCLSEYDKDFRTGDAWKAFDRFRKQKGSVVKYNMFDGLFWQSIWDKLKKADVTKLTCLPFSSGSWFSSASADDKASTYSSQAIIQITNESLPQKSGVNMGVMKPGDIVGLIHRKSKNKARAFCDNLEERAGLDMFGNFDKVKFEFNTHVGFVAAIRNGVPIIVHNASGTYYAVPATQAMSIMDDDMIAWVVSDPEVQSELERRKGKGSKISPKTPWGSSFSDPVILSKNFGIN